MTHLPGSPDCDHAAAIAADRLAGIATPDATTRLEAHLAVCSQCRAALADLPRAQSAIASLVIPREHAEARTTRLRFPSEAPELPQPSFRSRLARWTAVAAAILLAFIAGQLSRTAPRASPNSTDIVDSTRSSLLTAATRIARERPDTPPMAVGLLSIARR